MRINNVVVKTGVASTIVTVNATDVNKIYAFTVAPEDVVDVTTELVRSMSNNQKADLLFNLGWER